MSYKFARRSFLSGLGASTILLPLLRNIEAQAQGAAPPRRLLVILKPVGVVRADYLPTGTPTATGTSNFQWRPITQPFEPLRSRVVLIDGINHVAESLDANEPRHGGADTHEGGVVALMTGVPTLGRIGTQDHVAGGASFDQIFLEKSPFLGGAASSVKTPFPSLQLGTDTRADRNEISPRVMSYKAPVPGERDLARARQPLYPEIRPINVFDRVFGGAVIPDATPADLAAIRAQKKSLLDYMNKDLKRLETLVSTSYKVKIEAHAAAIRGLETSINATLSGMEPTGTPGATSCAKPTRPAVLPDNPDYWYDNHPEKQTYHPHQTVGRLHLQLVKAAFQCDLTRVVTFMWSPGTNMVVFGGLFDGMQVGGHHVMSHGGGFGEGWLTRIDQWYSEQTAAALQEFVTPETVAGGTGTLLDNTVVLYTSEVGRASHNWGNIPTILVGGQNMGITGNRFMKPAAARPFNDVWLGLAPAFGINDMTRHGGSTQFTGPLPNLRTA